MTIRSKLKKLTRRALRPVADAAQDVRKDHHDVGIALSTLLLEPDALSGIRFPVAYVEFLRHCIEPVAYPVAVIKTESSPPDTRANQFEMLVDRLRKGLPAIEYPVARDIGLIADRYRNLPEPIEVQRWVGDMGLHFSISSSFGRKGRILFNIVRFMRCESCLELGTAYGMSALFILAALKAYAQSGLLATIEAWDSIFSLSSSMLKQKYGEMVSCHRGASSDVLPKLLLSLGSIDFMFHDSTHTGAAYIRDFNQVVENLAPGAAVLFDDIRWDDHRIVAGGTNTYRGWKTVISHPRVRRAIEIDGMLGLLLLNSQ